MASLAVLPSAEDRSEAAPLDWAAHPTPPFRCKPDLQRHKLLLVAVLQISPCHCKQDLQQHKLLVIVLRRQAYFALVVVPEDLSMAPEEKAPSAALSSPVVAAAQYPASQHQLWLQTVSPAAALEVELLWQTSLPLSSPIWQRMSQRAMRPRRGH